MDVTSRHSFAAQDPKKAHMLDRAKIAEVVCALCDLRQPVGKECKACGVQFGCYSCLICNFFDDDLKKLQFHCEDCGEQRNLVHPWCAMLQCI